MSKLKFHDSKTNSVIINLNQTEWIKITDNGFWVRGVKVEQDEKEAKTVYDAFREFLTWATITQDYKK